MSYLSFLNSADIKLPPRSKSLKELAESNWDKHLKRTSQHKWLLYVSNNTKTLFSLTLYKPVLSIAPSTLKLDVSGLPFCVVSDDTMFNDLFESFVGKGNSYLYQELGKGRESRKIPTRKKKEE